MEYPAAVLRLVVIFLAGMPVSYYKVVPMCMFTCDNLNPPESLEDVKAVVSIAQ